MRWAARVGVLLAVSAVLFTTTGRSKMRDFEVYWTAGARASAAAPLYRADDQHYRFKYLPGFAIVAAPLAQLPLQTAKAVWMTLSIFCLAGLVAISVRLAEPSSLSPPWLAALTVIAMAKFFAHELVLGQANLLFGAVCAVALIALVRGRELGAGAAFGAATLVKPYAVLFVPYLLLTRRWIAAAAATAVTATVVALPVLNYGVSGTWTQTLEWWRTVSETSVPLLTNPDAISVFAMYAKWIGWGSVAAMASLITIALLGVAFLFVVAVRGGVARPEILEVGLVLTLVPLITPQGWDYVLLLSTPMVALLLARADRMRPCDRLAFGISLAVVAFSLYDVLGRAAYARFMALSVITVCYMAIIAVAVRLRVRGQV